VHEASITVILVAIIGSIGGYLTFLQARRSNRREEVAEAITEWKDLYTGVTAENSRLKQDVGALRIEIHEVRRHVDECEANILQMRLQHDQDKQNWERERSKLYRRLYRYEHDDDTTPPPLSRGT